MKRETRRKLREYRRNKITREDYLRTKEKYRKKCNEKKKQKRREELQAIKNIKTEKEVWQYINKDRKSRETASQKIEMQQWKKHFMELLEGEEEEIREHTESKERQPIEENDITREEILKQIRKMKRGKAPGRDGIQNEAWMYGMEGILERTSEIMNAVWKGEGLPRQWMEGAICPIFKKGQKENVKNYRGITLLNTGYKMYASVLNERLKKELKEKGVLPDGQAGFRAGRGTMDNVYILNHIVEKELEKKAGRIYALFMDLKAAFDKVDRKQLWECLRKRGVSEWLVNRIEEIYKETKNVVRVNGKESEWFWTRKGLRQGCPLSPLLFAAYIGDIDEVFIRAQVGGVVAGREKVWTLGYADDMVVIAKEEKEMIGMIKNMERYIRRKKLEVNVEKTKMMVFGKGRGRRKECEWKWEGKKVEQVKEFRYLGYMLNERNTVRAHVKELVRKANKVVGIVWGIGERKFGHNIKRRLMMFDCLVKSVLMYGAEIWGWKEEEEIERVQEKYLKWMLGLDRETPSYIVREEMKRCKLRVEAGMRAVKFEERMGERTECKILQECWKEIEGSIGETRRKERGKYYERNGYACAEIARWRRVGRRMKDELRMRDEDVDKQERRARIKESRYNGKYKELITSDETPKYLERESGKEKKVIARFRCGNEERENKFWLEMDERKCRMCQDESETIEHMLKECEGLKERNEERKEVLNEDGRGLEWMREVLRVRESIRG